MRLFLICFFAALCVFGTEKINFVRSVTTTQSLVLPCDSPPDSALARIARADASLENIALDFAPSKKGSAVISERPCAVACLDESSGAWYVVRFAMPYPLKKYFRALKKAGTLAEREKCVLPLRSLDAGFRVTHISGAGPSLLVVKVEREEEGKWHELVPYRLLFSRLPKGDDVNLSRARKAVCYVRSTPVSSRFVTEAFAQDGEKFLRGHVRSACAALAEEKVASKAFPGKQLSEIFPPEVIMALMVSEQWDPLYYQTAREESLRRILATYALNREHAFEWSASSAAALGCLQFTNARGNGTYAQVVRTYADAHLVRNFEDGARDMHNVVKTAICLLDAELARSDDARKAFLIDPYLGALYAVAAYNGGHGAAEKILAEIRRINAAPLSRLDRTLLALPRVISRYAESRTRKHRRAAALGNAETPLYAKKYLYLIEHFTRTHKAPETALFECGP